ncbi:hypothetical protein NSPZN2_130075 [Nitrospira defluvii]|uniref:Transposase n=1 Tax=Nitrospira defluvii TaxID=330214 RepID=A0ABM8R9E9_9BACT|nr:hypothetical protein NSPZN2_130075 [Nitrospira defluvii]
MEVQLPSSRYGRTTGKLRDNGREREGGEKKAASLLLPKVIYTATIMPARTAYHRTDIFHR